MNMLLNLESPVTTAHRAKLAYIYVRQSTVGQVRQHQESTELQYRLVDRAALFGWPKERIEVIDDDLGKSGASSDSRGGFPRLIGEVGLGKAGLVLSLDASGLARNNHDWHQLLELCSLFGVLIARRLADNLNHYDANRHGVPRQGNALLQGIAICGRCGRRMGLHYSGQNGNYPVYLCRADQHQHGGPRRQGVRPLGVDTAVQKFFSHTLATP